MQIYVVEDVKNAHQYGLQAEFLSISKETGFGYLLTSIKACKILEPHSLQDTNEYLMSCGVSACFWQSFLIYTSVYLCLEQVDMQLHETLRLIILLKNKWYRDINTLIYIEMREMCQ